LNIGTTYLGEVTEGAVTINGESWGNITEWKDKYDNAIGNLLGKEEAGAALSAI
jgi:phosphoribosylformylglycinamidine synthase